MKLFRNGQKIIVGLFVIILAALAAGSAWAGGWATIEIDNLPGEIHAGENIHLSFMVYQHGNKPVHFLTGWESDPTPVKPLISGINSKTGETIEITAVLDENEVGRFYADIVFPSSGEWTWTIEPVPLVGTTEMASLNILPALKAPDAETGKTTETAAPAATNPLPAFSGWTGALRWIGGFLLIVGLAMLGVFVSRKRQGHPIVDVGD